MDYTTNYGLRKPEPTDYYDVADANFNMDKIDLTLKDNENAIANHTAATTGVHGATSAATPNTIVQRDSAGRAKVAAPAAADDIARKDTVDAVQTNLTNHINATTGVHGATSAATPNTIVQRDSAGRFKAAAPSASDDVARKAEVDYYLGFGIGTVAKDISGTDLNNLTNTGFYRGSNLTNSPNPSHYYFVIHIQWNATTALQILYRNSHNGYQEVYHRIQNSGTWSSWLTHWNSGNDGAGSGLDADFVRGMDPDRFIFGDNSRGTITLSGGDLNELSKSGFYHTSTSTLNQPPGVSSGFVIHINHPGNNDNAFQLFQAGANLFYVRRKNGGVWGNWSKLWTELNDGAGSGLDADLLDGMQPSSGNAANTIVQRDGSGNIRTATRIYFSNDDFIEFDDSSDTYKFMDDGGSVDPQDSTIQAGKLRLTWTNDVSETSTNHAFQIGPNDGQNFRANINELMFVDNGVLSYGHVLGSVVDIANSLRGNNGGNAQAKLGSTWYDIWHAGNNGPGRIIPLFSLPAHVAVNGPSGDFTLVCMLGNYEIETEPFGVRLEEALYRGRSVYFEAVIHALAGTTTAYLSYKTGESSRSIISSVTTTSKTPTRVRSAAIAASNLNQALAHGTLLHVGLSNNSGISSNGRIYSARLIII